LLYKQLGEIGFVDCPSFQLKNENNHLTAKAPRVEAQEGSVTSN